MWGIVPAAGRGSRIQPLAFSKELLPVGSRTSSDTHRPCAVGEYLLERMVRGGADKICFVIGAGKSDILEYFGARFGVAELAYVVQAEPIGLCDAVFRAHTLIRPDESVIVGLPDTIWFPTDALATLPDDTLSFLLFPVDHPERFDAVLLDGAARVTEIRVKEQNAGTNWIWGCFKMPGTTFHALRSLWLQRNRCDEYFGTLVNAYLAGGGEAIGIKSGDSYIDVGTLHGYRNAMLMLSAAELPTELAAPTPKPAQELRP